MDAVEKALDGSHMCFIAAGMGGGTGTGAAPVIAKAARDRGILTVGVVTKPFSFEGNRRMRSADAGIEELQKHVDTLIVIPNQNLFLIANPNTTFKEAFQMADQVLQQGVRGITDLMVMPGLINLDFADIRSVMSEMGKAMMGTGEASGDNRAIEAAEKAIANPLLDGVSLNGAKGVIVSITGGDDMRLLEVDEAANHIRQLVDQDANIIWGSAFNNDLEGKIRVSVVATGIEVDAATMPEPSKSFSFPPRTPAREERSVAVPQAAAPAPAPTTTSQPAAPLTAPTIQPATETPAEERIVLEAPEAAAEPLELTNLFNDELLLQPEAAMPTPAPEAKAEEAPEAGGNRRWVAEPEPARRQSAAGATLFERMSNIARGAAKAQVAPEDAAVEGAEIPRFLNRQGNQ
jgi:cell division protein FtsZ